MMQLLLARQRPRARERARARGDSHARRGDRARFAARSYHRRREPIKLVDERPVRNPTLETIERAYIMWVLQSEAGNKTRAAETLGIDPSTLHRKLSRFGADA